MSFALGKTVLRNLHNWRSAARVCTVICMPVRFYVAILRGRTLNGVTVRTPAGRVSIALRNFESLKTVFSIFCREDYKTASDERASNYMDIGANIGIASIYFLSRNSLNRVVCFEPDPANLPFLEDNLEFFRGRYEIRNCALGLEGGIATFYKSDDGKYSSLVPSDRAKLPVEIGCKRFEEELRGLAADSDRLVVKIDVEGLEAALTRSVRWEDFPNVTRLLADSTECAEGITGC